MLLLGEDQLYWPKNKDIFTRNLKETERKKNFPSETRSLVIEPHTDYLSYCTRKYP
jgi:hypothetical protein